MLSDKVTQLSNDVTPIKQKLKDFEDALKNNKDLKN